jgi:hypothetical protein
MPAEVVQQFLDQGLLNLGEERDKFDYVANAAAELAETLRDDRRLVFRSASLLMASGSLAPEPLVNLCAEAIKKQWPTYQSRFPGEPRELFRATLLEALHQVASSEDTSYAAIIFYAASSLLPYVTPAREEELFRRMIVQLGGRVEAQAAVYWVPPTLGELDEPSFGKGTVALPAVNVKPLLEGLKGAAGPATGIAGANPQWPSANSQEWLEHFAKTSAEAIGAIVAAAIKDAATKLISQARADAVLAVRGLGSALSGNQFEHRRADLLYWKESLYSPSRRTGYRSMQDDEAAYRMAVDLHAQVPALHPHSVEYFLRETLRDALGDGRATGLRNLGSFCEALKRGDELARGNLNPDERLLLVEAIGGAAGHGLPIGDLLRRVGVDAEREVALEELAVWVFRDLQVRRLLEAKADA